MSQLRFNARIPAVINAKKVSITAGIGAFSFQDKEPVQQ
jgi:hypothetical protein